MDKLELNNFEGNLYLLSGRDIMLKRYRNTAIAIFLAFSAFFAVIWFHYGTNTFTVGLMIFYMFINMLELLSFVRVYKAYRTLLRKLGERLKTRTGLPDFDPLIKFCENASQETMLLLTSLSAFASVTIGIVCFHIGGNDIAPYIFFYIYIALVLINKMCIVRYLSICKKQAFTFGKMLNELTYPEVKEG